MTLETFKAGTQYNDHSGSVSVDDRDMGGLHEYFRKNGAIGEGEYLVGIEVYSGLGPGSTHDGTIQVAAFIVSANGYENAAEMVASSDPLLVRKFDVEMTFIEFFSLFKRFSLTLSTNSMLEGRQISY